MRASLTAHARGHTGCSPGKAPSSPPGSCPSGQGLSLGCPAQSPWLGSSSGSSCGVSLSSAGITSQQHSSWSTPEGSAAAQLQHGEQAAEPLLPRALLEMDCQAKQHPLCFQVDHARLLAWPVLSRQRQMSSTELTREQRGSAPSCAWHSATSPGCWGAGWALAPSHLPRAGDALLGWAHTGSTTAASPAPFGVGLA